MKPEQRKIKKKQQQNEKTLCFKDKLINVYCNL